MTAERGVRNSWLMLARKELLARLADSAASLAAESISSASLRSVMSVCDATHSRIVPSSSMTGAAFKAMWRHSPSYRRMRCSRAIGVRAATASRHAARVVSTSSGCTQAKRPHPIASSAVWPVKRFQFGWAFAKAPVGSAVQIMAALASTRVRKRSSPSFVERSARFRAVTSAITMPTPLPVPATLRG